jgi:tetrahydromethanopterin S-methyltransferase subunit G
MVKVTLEMVYNEVRELNRRLAFIEDVIEEVFVSLLPEANLSEEELAEIKKRIGEMKKGNYVALEEIKSV